MAWTIKLSELTSATTVWGADIIPVVQSWTTKTVTWTILADNVDDLNTDITTNDWTQTLTSKTIDVDNNTVSNLEVDNFKTWVIDTDIALTADSDTKIATQKATKAYVDWIQAITWELRIWTTDSAPSWWLISNWDAINRTTYATLFAVIWETYWVWDWSTTFNLPDLRGNTPIWKDWATFTALWDTWWEETHTLTENEMPAHTHDTWTWAGGWIIEAWTSKDTETSAFKTASTWWWAAHNILQPYLVINYIIKT